MNEAPKDSDRGESDHSVSDHSVSDHWARVAAAWIEWARAPNHDAFWAYRAALLDFIGKGPGDALDVGCGEGRVSRMLKEAGYRVTAADPVPAFLAAAEQENSADVYVPAHADQLPFPDASFDLVIAYNVLMDIEDVPAAVREIRRVLRPSGTVFISVVHPLADHGRFAGEPDAPIAQTPYFERTAFSGDEERNGLTMHFAGWCLPLQDYMAALEQAGLAITSLREPVPASGEDWAHLRNRTRVPLFLWLKARLLSH